MFRRCSPSSPDPRCGIGSRFLTTVVFCLIFGLAFPSWGASDRAVKSRVAPIYPEIAKRMRICGEVKVEATVDSEGTVKDVKAVTGNHILEVAAEEAVRKWKFETGDGDAKVTVSVNFALGQ